MAGPAPVNATAIALDLLDRGWQPVLLKPRSKVPPRDGWQNLRYTPAEIRRVFAGACNVGINLGEASDNTVDVDVDHPKGAAALQALGAPSTLMYHHAGRPHLLYHCEPAPATTKYQGIRGGKVVTFMEVRSTGAQSVAPGSIHPDDGQEYCWSNSLPRADLAPWDVVNLARDLATVCLLADHWQAPDPGESGARHALALGVAGFLARRTSSETVWEIVEAAARMMGDGELGDRRRAVEDTLSKARRGIPVVGLPTLAALIGDDDARTLAKWWPDNSPELTVTGPVIADPFSVNGTAAAPATAWEWPVYDGADFLARELPPVQWQIDGMIRDSAIVWLFGAPGTIKTYIATDAALAIATGSKFLGQFEARPGAVLIVQEDTLESDYQQVYLRPMLDARGLPPEVLRGRLFVAPPAGLKLDDHERLAALVAWLDAHPPVSLIVLDAFYLFHGGEGFGKDLGPVLDVARRLRARYGCAVLIVDHNRKGGRDRDAEDADAIDRLYGGRAKSAAADAVVEVRRVKGEPGVVHLQVLKLRGGKPAEGVRVRLEHGALTAEGEAAETVAGAARTIHDWLLRQGGSRTKAQIQKGVNLSERSVHAGCAELLEQRLIQKAGKVGRADTWLGLRQAIDPDTGEVPW